VRLFNHSYDVLSWEARERVAQLVFSPVVRAELEDVGDGELSDTKRGVSGFGSTGA
jgi:dUTPase